MNKLRILLCVVMFSVLVVPTVASETVFEMPELDIQKTYGYNTTLDLFFPERMGKEAVLTWHAKEVIDNKTYYVQNLSKPNGSEVQYLGIDRENEDLTLKKIVEVYDDSTLMNLTFNPESLYLDYPIYVGKTWNRTSNFSGIVRIGMPPSEVFVTGTSVGYANVTGEEDIVVPAGVFHCLHFNHHELYYDCARSRNVHVKVTKDLAYGEWLFCKKATLYGWKFDGRT